MLPMRGVVSMNHQSTFKAGWLCSVLRETIQAYEVACGGILRAVSHFVQNGIRVTRQPAECGLGQSVGGTL